MVAHGRGRPGATEAPQADWIVRVDAPDPACIEELRAVVPNLGLGEAEVICTARAQRAAWALLDDRAGRALARTTLTRTKHTGVLGVLALAYRRKLVDDLPALFRALDGIGFRTSRAAQQQALREAGIAP